MIGAGAEKGQCPNFQKVAKCNQWWTKIKLKQTMIPSWLGLKFRTLKNWKCHNQSNFHQQAQCWSNGHNWGLGKKGTRCPNCQKVAKCNQWWVKTNVTQAMIISGLGLKIGTLKNWKCHNQSNNHQQAQPWSNGGNWGLGLEKGHSVPIDQM